MCTLYIVHLQRDERTHTNNTTSTCRTTVELNIQSLSSRLSAQLGEEDYAILTATLSPVVENSDTEQVNTSTCIIHFWDTLKYCYISQRWFEL